jgi:N-methylhydantoinase B
MNKTDVGSFQGMSAILYRIFSSTLSTSCSNALVLPDGQALFVNPKAASDIATLPQAAALCHRYLKLGDGDVALTNDPYSGGTHLAEFTLVTGVSLFGGEIDFLLVQRVSFAPRLPDDLKKTARIDDEGVRVPPMPLGRLENLNRDLLQAIAMHPLAPRELVGTLESAVSDLERAAVTLKRLATDPSSVLRKKILRSHIDAYFADSARVFEIQMAKLPLGNSLVSHQFATGETIKLELKMSEDRLVFDFGGSEASVSLGLTDLATFGACFAATVSAFDSWVPMNAATFQHLQVSAPVKTILSANAPLGTLRGMLEGVPAVCRLAREAFTRLNRNFRSAEAANSHSAIQLLFDDGRLLSLAIPHGSAASPGHAGIDGLNLWMNSSTLFGGPARTYEATVDIERLDRDFPIHLGSLGLRAASAGHGKASGGNGTTLGLKVLAPCELRWLDPSMGTRNDGIDSGRAGTAAALEIVHLNGTREALSTCCGSHRLQKGEQLFVLTSGGGGCGEPPNADTH